MKFFFANLATLFFFCFFITLELHAWTWTYKIHVDKSNNSSWITEKTKIPPFGQLIFSWKAARPAKGYFCFWIQVRDKATQKWYSWHEVAQWGTNRNGDLLQKTCYSKHRRGTNHAFVRLELPEKKYADAFRLKVVAHNNAFLKQIQRVVINTVNLKKFCSQVGSISLRNLPSVYIADVPKISQKNIRHPKRCRLCSPASMAMVLEYLLKRKFDVGKLADSCYDNGLNIYGSWPCNVAHANELCKEKYMFHVERLNSFKDLHAYLIKGMPCIVSIRGMLKGAPQNIKGKDGHMLVVVGYNNRFDKVLCHDPAGKNDVRTAVAYDLNDFLAAWERSHRLAYVVSN